jgi:alanine racemase
MRPTRALIDLDNFRHNIRAVRSRIGSAPRIMAVVKANAYGHGLEIIARCSENSGEVSYFGVATEEEGIALRQLTSLPILVLTTAIDDEIDTFISNDLEFTLSSIEQIDAIASRADALGRRAKVHLKVDTGMRRVGVEPQDALSAAEQIAKRSAFIEFIGISTHYATSDEQGSSFFRKQTAIFNDVVGRVRGEGITVPIAHAANSGAILQNASSTSFDMVRPGIMLYGYAPSEEMQSMYGNELKPALEFISSVGFVKRIGAREGVSYNHRWISDRPTSIATVAAGYGDGYPRLLTNNISSLIRNKLYPVRGTICMDQILIETGDDDVRIGDDVVLLSARDPALNAWSLAKKIGTIPYEILTNITARVPRISKEQ